MKELTDEMISEYLARISANGLTGISIFLKIGIGALVIALVFFALAKVLEDKLLKSMTFIYALAKIFGTISVPIFLFCGMLFFTSSNNAEASKNFIVKEQKIIDKRQEEYEKRVYDADDTIGRIEIETKYTMVFENMGERNVYSRQYEVGDVGDTVYIVMYQDTIKVMYNANEYTYKGSRLSK